MTMRGCKSERLRVELSTVESAGPYSDSGKKGMRELLKKAGINQAEGINFNEAKKLVIAEIRRLRIEERHIVLNAKVMPDGKNWSAFVRGYTSDWRVILYDRIGGYKGGFNPERLSVVV